jgi:hypothetical protein
MSLNNFDIAIVYRIYPGVSKIPLAYPEDKFKMSELCLASFVRALESINAHVTVLLDNCPDEYNRLFEKYLDGIAHKLVNLPKTGNAGTFGMQMDILLEQENSEIIYFAEDDYFYLPGAFKESIAFMKNNPDCDFLTPYDHPDLYGHPLHNYRGEFRLGKRHWRTCGSTTMTFMTKKKILRESEKIFRSYTKNNYDAGLWLSATKANLTGFFDLIKWSGNRQIRNIILKMYYFNLGQILFGRKYKLWSPMPSLATHMDSEGPSPFIDWQKEFSKTDGIQD